MEPKGHDRAPEQLQRLLRPLNDPGPNGGAQASPAGPERPVRARRGIPIVVGQADLGLAAGSRPGMHLQPPASTAGAGLPGDWSGR